MRYVDIIQDSLVNNIFFHLLDSSLLLITFVYIPKTYQGEPFGFFLLRLILRGYDLLLQQTPETSVAHPRW